MVKLYKLKHVRRCNNSTSQGLISRPFDCQRLSWTIHELFSNSQLYRFFSTDSATSLISSEWEYSSKFQSYYDMLMKFFHNSKIVQQC